MGNGLLLLPPSTGKFRATPELISLALCDSPDDKKGHKRWKEVIQKLKQKQLITHRETQDELRIWQGSDFDTEAAIAERIEQSHLLLADLLTAIYPAKPLVAQRHYTATGTLRYFEQRYVDSRANLSALRRSPSFASVQKTSHNRFSSFMNSLLVRPMG